MCEQHLPIAWSSARGESQLLRPLFVPLLRLCFRRVSLDLESILVRGRWSHVRDHAPTVLLSIYVVETLPLPTGSCPGVFLVGPLGWTLFRLLRLMDGLLVGGKKQRKGMPYSCLELALVDICICRQLVCVVQRFQVL